MYNGIGLSTARGSGTNGYVQANKASLRPSFHNKPDYRAKDFQRAEPGQGFSALGRQPNQEILLHEKKREVEIKCIELQDELEAKGLPEADVEARVDSLRQKLLKEIQRQQEQGAELMIGGVDGGGRGIKAHDTHLLAQAKKRENEKLAAAFRIREDDYVEGASFDPEYREKKRQQRILEREKREEERRKQIEEREQRQKEMQKRMAEEAKARAEQQKQRDQAVKEAGEKRGRDEEGVKREMGMFMFVIWTAREDAALHILAADLLSVVAATAHPHEAEAEAAVAAAAAAAAAAVPVPVPVLALALLVVIVVPLPVPAHHPLAAAQANPPALRLLHLEASQAALVVVHPRVHAAPPLDVPATPKQVRPPAAPSVADPTKKNQKLAAVPPPLLHPPNADLNTPTPAPAPLPLPLHRLGLLRLALPAAGPEAHLDAAEPPLLGLQVGQEADAGGVEV
ncbi:RNA-splicing factor [Chytridiales sp. JEL 0842]|nr:RNA-splicing factor [Chytridiales sp. JEL 0842]